jgi:outer membrane protein
MEEKMKKIVLTMVLAVILTTLVFAEAEKLAYIDTDRIMMTSPETQEAQTILMGERQKWEQEIADMDAELEQLYADYESTKIMSMNEARQAKVQELFGENGTFVQRQNELLAPILNKLKTIIEKVAVENNYSIILDASAGSILYAKPNLEITDSILDEMEKSVE